MVMEVVVGVWHVTWPWRKGRRSQRALGRAKKKKIRARTPPCSQQVASCLFKRIRVWDVLKQALMPLAGLICPCASISTYVFRMCFKQALMPV